MTNMLKNSNYLFLLNLVCQHKPNSFISQMLGILSATFYNFRQIRSSYSVKNVTKYFYCRLDGSPIRAQD